MLPKGLHEGGVVLEVLDESDVEIFDFTGAIGRGRGKGKNSTRMIEYHSK